MSWCTKIIFKSVIPCGARVVCWKVIIFADSILVFTLMFTLNFSTLNYIHYRFVLFLIKPIYIAYTWIYTWIKVLKFIIFLGILMTPQFSSLQAIPYSSITSTPEYSHVHNARSLISPNVLLPSGAPVLPYLPQSHYDNISHRKSPSR